MSALRKILLPLLIIPLGMLAYASIYPEWQWENPGFEFLFLIVGIPIFFINFAIWFQPEFIKTYFPIKDDGGQGQNRLITLAIVMSTLIAFTFSGVSVMSAISKVSSQPALTSSAVLPATATAFALSLEMPLNAADSGEKVIIPKRPDMISNQTAQIPVSGGVPTNSPTLAVTQPEVTSLSVEPTSTVDLFERCTPATPAYLEAVWQAVEDADFDSEVETGWMVQSKDAANLWFVAAKIYRPEITAEAALPGVWALFVYSEGNFDIYSINDVAMDFSYTAWGEDSEPVITMQNDGAQIAYDCAMHGE